MSNSGVKKRIAFFDYDLNNFHADTYLRLARGELSARGFEVVVCRGLLEEPSRRWAEKNGVPYADTIEDLNARSDYLVVLAPSNPEMHLEMAEKALPFGKPTYIDKTFAPDTETARRIFDLADRYGAPVITSSALRFTDELRELLQTSGRDSILQFDAWGPGGSFEEYAIHPLELVISTMGPDVSSVMSIRTDTYSNMYLNFTDGRTATAHVCIGVPAPFMVVAGTKEYVKHMEITSPIFYNMLSAIMDFFEAGKETIDRRESLVIRRILDLAMDDSKQNAWHKVSI